MSLAVLPLAITMMAGPQIMSDLIFVTSPKPVRICGAFLTGVAIAVTAGVAIAIGLVSLLGIDLGDSSDSGSTGHVIQYGLVALLVFAAIRNYLHRDTIEPPKWLGKLMEADARRAFVTGLVLIMFFPSDVIVMLTVATNIDQGGGSLADAIPFIAVTILIAALPLLAYLLFRRRAKQSMPRVRDWMYSNSWLVNIIVCGIFIALILA